MAHTKAGGSTHLGRDSQSKRLGIKAFSGEYVTHGSILVRQRGTRYRPGDHVKLGCDDTLFALASGIVRIKKIKRKSFTGALKLVTYFHIDPVAR